MLDTVQWYEVLYVVINMTALVFSVTNLANYAGDVRHAEHDPRATRAQLELAYSSRTNEFQRTMGSSLMSLIGILSMTGAPNPDPTALPRVVVFVAGAMGFALLSLYATWRDREAREAVQAELRGEQSVATVKALTIRTHAPLQSDAFFDPLTALFGVSMDDVTVVVVRLERGKPVHITREGFAYTRHTLPPAPIVTTPPQGGG